MTPRQADKRRTTKPTVLLVLTPDQARALLSAALVGESMRSTVAVDFTGELAEPLRALRKQLGGES